MSKFSDWIKNNRKYSKTSPSMKSQTFHCQWAANNTFIYLQLAQSELFSCSKILLQLLCKIYFTCVKYKHRSH